MLCHECCQNIKLQFDEIIDMKILQDTENINQITYKVELDVL